jgi:plastocyanin
VRGSVYTAMRGIASLLTLAAGLVLAAPAAAADHPISFANYAYNPADVTIAVNDTATFSGNFMSHPLAWDSGQFAPTTSGSSKQFAFAVPGTYTYYCQIHRDPPFNMRGVIRVAGNQHPAHVAFTVSLAAPAVGQTVTFTYTGYPDPDGTLVRWEWDLDGDGSFETSTATPTATRVYTAPGALTVRMRAVDNGNEPSAVVEQALTIAAADTTAPRATRVRLRGLTLSFRSSERATATATLRARGRTLARGTARAGRTTIKLRLTTAGRRVLVRGRRVRATLSLTLRDPARNARTTRRQMTVRRR